MYEPKEGTENYNKIKSMQEFLDEQNLEHRTSNNGVHIIVDIKLEEEEIRLNIWPTSQLLHVVKGKKINKFRGLKTIHGKVIELARLLETTE